MLEIGRCKPYAFERSDGMRKRIGLISSLMGALLALLISPITALAGGVACGGGEGCNHVAQYNGNHYATLDEAIDDAKDGGLVVLISDVDVSDTGLVIQEEESVVLDLLGYTLTVSDSAGGCIAVQGSLTIQDSTSTSGNFPGSGKIVCSKESAVCSPNNFLVLVKEGGYFSLNSGNIIAENIGASGEGQCAVGVQQNVTFFMHGGRIEASGYALSQVNSGTASEYHTFLCGGELISTESFAMLLGNDTNTVVSDTKVCGLEGGIYHKSGNLEIHSGAVISSAELNAAGESGSPAIYVDCPSDVYSVEIESGKLTAAPGVDVVAKSESSRASIQITGGSYSKSVQSEYLQDGYTCIPNGDTYLVVPADKTDAVAVIRDRYFTTVSAALDAANAQDTVLLLKDATLGEDTYEFKGLTSYVTLDLGGHTLTGGQINVLGGELYLKNGEFISENSNAINLYGFEEPFSSYIHVVIKDDAVVKSNQGYGIGVYPSRGDGNTCFGIELEIYGTVSGSKGGLYASEAIGGSEEANASMTAEDNAYALPWVFVNEGSEVSGGETGPGIDLDGLVRVDINTGSTVSGTEAVRVKRGILDVYGGNLTAVGIPAESSEGTELASEDTGAAVSITSKHSNFGLIDIAIESGTLRGTNGAAVYLGHSTNGDELIPFGVSPSLRVRNGFFSGKDNDVIVAPSIDGDVSYSQGVITGGFYVHDPSSYVDEHYEALPGGPVGSDEYNYVINGPLEPTSGRAVEGSTIVDSSKLSSSLDEGAKQAFLDAAASVVADSGVLAGAAEQHLYEIDANVSADAIEAFKQSSIEWANIVAESEIKVYVQAYLAVTPLDCDATARTLTLDIAPMYRVVASTATSGEEIKVLGEVSDGANAVVLGGSEKSLFITSSFDYSMNPPVSILPLEDSHLFVKNISDDFVDSYRKAGVHVDSGAISFWRNAGLSTFEIRYDDRLAPVTYGNYTRNLRLDWVGDEIFSAPATSEGQKFLGWSFAKYIGGNEVYQVLTDDLLTDLSEYYAVHPYEKIWAEPQFDPPMTEPDPDPEPTPDPDPTPTPTPDPKPDGDVVTNPDGSTTTTTTEESTDPDTGDVTTVVTEVTEGREDGSVTTVVTETVKGEGGKTSVTVTETTELADGTVATATSDGEGRVSTVKATVSADAAAAGPVALPVPALTAVADEGSATEISVSAPEGGATVVVPVEDVTPSAVLELIGADGSVTVLPKVALSEDGLAIALEEGATLRLVDRETSFPDVSEGDWYAGEVAPFVSSRGILTGVVTEGGTAEFRGDLGTDRAMFVTMLHRLELEPDSDGAQFADVPEGAWYAGAASWGDGTGVVAGYGDGTAFGGADPVTREQMAVFMFRYARWLGLDTSARADLDFPDGASVSGWAEEAMGWAVAEGLFTGDAGTGALRPTDGATRAEAAAVIMRLVNGVLL